MTWLLSWETLFILMLIVYIPCCIGLIAIVLLQKGKGVGFAGAFGIGAGSDTVFGPRMSKSLPQKLTYVMAALFMIMAFTMSLVSGRLGKGVAPDKAPEQSVNMPTDLTGLEDLGKDIGGATPSAGAVTVTPEAPATPPAGAVTVTPEAPATPPAGGSVTVTPVAPADAPAPPPPPPPAAPEQHPEPTSAPGASQ
jgi:protein translocase SecG subunit